MTCMEKVVGFRGVSLDRPVLKERGSVQSGLKLKKFKADSVRLVIL